ncbi:MAG: alpha/beta hydrolase [Nitrososphaerales archaeon]
METRTGLNIFYRYWPGRDLQENVILCIHGLAGDSRIFNYFAEKSSNLGCNVYAIDLPGFGMSNGEKGDLPFDITMNCLHDVIAQIKNKHGNARIFLLGFSLGGLHALWYTSLHKEMLTGTIVVAPHLRIKGVKRAQGREPSKRVLLAALLKYFVTPSKKGNLSEAIPSAFGELAGEEWIHMMKDPLCNFNYSYRYIFNVLTGKAEKVEALHEIISPILVLHGSKDPTVVLEQSKVLMNKLKSYDKELKVFDCGHWFYHTFFYRQANGYSDDDRMKVVKTINKWIQNRTV